MRYFHSLALIFFITTAGFSQEQKRMNFGVKTGVVISSFWGNGIDNFEKALSEQLQNFDPDMLLSLTVAGLISYEFIPGFFNIQGELQYLRLGKNWELDLPDGEKISFGLSTDYLSVPVLFKLLIPINKSVLPEVYAGPSFFIQLHSRAKNLSVVPQDAQRGFLKELGTNQNVSKQISNFDIGFQTGLNINFPIKRGTVVLDLRFGFGSIDTFNSDKAEDIRNSSFSIMVGYLFR